MPNTTDHPCFFYIRTRFLVWQHRVREIIDTNDMPDGVPEQVVSIVTENSRTLKFDTQGFEEE